MIDVCDRKCIAVLLLHSLHLMAERGESISHSRSLTAQRHTMLSAPQRSHHRSHTSAAVLSSNVTWQRKVKEMRKSLTKACLKEDLSHQQLKHLLYGWEAAALKKCWWALQTCEARAVPGLRPGFCLKTPAFLFFFFFCIGYYDRCERGLHLCF